MKNFVKKALEAGGSIHPLIIPAELTNGTGLMNPSVMILNNKIIVIIRHVNYTFYHSEAKMFQHQFGPLTYVHPEQDLHLRTINYYCELNGNYEITRYNKIDTSEFDTYAPLWDFVGHRGEDRAGGETNRSYTCNTTRRPVLPSHPIIT